MEGSSGPLRATRSSRGEALRDAPGAGSVVNTWGPVADPSPASATTSRRLKSPVLPGSPLPARSGWKSELPSPLTARS